MSVVINVNGLRHRVQGAADYTAALCPSRRGSPSRSALRLWPSAVWSVRSTHGWQRDPFLRHSGCGRGRSSDYDGGRSSGCIQGLQAGQRSAPGAAGVDRRAGAAVRFLPERHGIQAVDLLSQHKHPTEDLIRTAMNGHLCRCGTYNSIVRAITRAAKSMA